MEDPDLEKIEIKMPGAVTIETTFTLFYTSGTTGAPKGAEVTNRNMISCMYTMFHHYPMSEEDVMILFIPLAHGFGRAAYVLALAYGASVGSCGGDFKKILESINILKPTFLPCVPRLFNRLYDLLTAEI